MQSPCCNLANAKLQHGDCISIFMLQLSTLPFALFYVISYVSELALSPAAHLSFNIYFFCSDCQFVGCKVLLEQ